MEPFDDDGWDLLDYGSFIDGVGSTDLYWANPRVPWSRPIFNLWLDDNVQVDASLPGAETRGEECTEKECPRKRGRNDPCSRLGTKACRERQRRERLNDRFLELSSVLEPGRAPKTDKFAILGDAIRVLKQLRTESQEFKETNEKLLEEIKSLKAEKNEIREEKLVLKADKERMERLVKGMSVSPPGFLPAHPAQYHSGASKMAVFPGYGFVPMWQYLPQSTMDTSKDQELRPPAA